MVKIVSAVRKFTKDKEEYVRVHYTDGSERIFNAFEWQALVKEGKDLWDSHQKEVSQARSDTDIDIERFND
tara:strand:- start:86 stop:298 length:213 start_codon:yes stop_codon:yes gene_type:complete